MASTAGSVSKCDSPTRIMTAFRSKSETSESSSSGLVDNEYTEKLLRIVKKEVKQIMEEAVTRKFVHEESSSITSLCSAVDACLSHGLKRRALGLFKTNSTTALLQKVAKNLEVAAVIAKMVSDIENADPNNDSTTKLKSQTSIPARRPPGSVQSIRFLWIRLALFEKVLARIVDHLVQNSSKYYEKDALVSDPVSGQILASLLVGPCALDYSKMKTQDHFWTDPPADELVQRHRLSSGLPQSSSPSTPPSVRRPGLHYRRDLKASGSSEEGHRNIPLVARDYVESLHQNSKSTLLYGKNNVLMQPRGSSEAMPGYLSLHHASESLIIKWTPNQIMNGCYSNSDNSSGDSVSSGQDKRASRSMSYESPSFFRQNSGLDSPVFWDYAMSVNMESIVYLHCHQHSDTDGTIVLVGHDGVQQPPIHFPKGGHMLSFLSCLENGLLPHGQLDPPLWAQKGAGKALPKVKRKSKPKVDAKKTSEGESTGEDGESTDFVFRVITSLKPETIAEELLEPKLSRAPSSWQQLPKDNTVGTARMSRLKHYSSSGSSASTSECHSIAEDSPGPTATVPQDELKTAVATKSAGQSIQLLCDTMKRQIISRAFYGWLAHCRHLRTVRTHLSGLVNPVIVSATEPSDATGGVTQEVWAAMAVDGRIENATEVYRLVYFGGVQHSVRKLVWPYLLGHYRLGSTEEERIAQDSSFQAAYENTMSEWLAVEAIVRQRDKEAATLAKLSSESTTSEIPLIGPKDANLSNDVFEDVSSDGGSFDQPDEGPVQNGTEGKPQRRESSADGDSESGTTTAGVANGECSQNGSVDAMNEDELSTTQKAQRRLRRHKKVESQSSQGIIVTNPSIDIAGSSPSSSSIPPEVGQQGVLENVAEGETGEDPSETGEQKPAMDELLPGDHGGDQLSVDSRSSCVSPASSSGGVYSTDLLDLFSLNLHRIDKDVQRCDRNYWYFTSENLEKLRNVMCTYVWEHLDVGYVQGMCDLVAPLLVIFDDEVLTYSCFCELMKRMAANFPHGGAMDHHFANMRSLIQILDAEMFELMHQNGDYTHFYFCYRWFLLDFKRELVYDDVFSVWETIWAARHVASSNLVLFIALAMVEYYRDIILQNNMDFTDIIKFFNEMAERHDAKAVLKISRELVLQIQTLIDNK
ncbi:small G protein signaling modulator 2-like isoform X3 [Ornithodoros turicata]|uniref:small G protein signaling modulator 2-like isoform X3 n=1 Tax=Ornithodoros turicata TaxID=34597 RepID=UPI0031393EA1